MLVTGKISVMARNWGSGNKDGYFGGSSVEYEVIMEHAIERAL